MFHVKHSYSLTDIRLKGDESMSQFGLKTAVKYGVKLKEFSDISEAENYYFSYRDCMLTKLETISKQNPFFESDYTLESLKSIEKWYFDLYEKNEFGQVGLTLNEFEKILSIYFGAVIVKNNEKAEWLVYEYPFSQNKYEFMVYKGNLYWSIINCFNDLCKIQNNKKRNYIYRKYNKYFAD